MTREEFEKLVMGSDAAKNAPHKAVEMLKRSLAVAPDQKQLPFDPRKS